jgi:hypothetical protein
MLIDILKAGIVGHLHLLQTEANDVDYATIIAHSTI